MSEDYVSKLQEDLRTKLDHLCWMQNEPALHVAEHFAELRRQVDLDAERLLGEIQWVKRETGKARKYSDVNETRLEFIRILQELEKRTIHRLDTQKSKESWSEACLSLESRVDGFLASSEILDDLEDFYVQLAREIIDESDQVEKRVLGEQTITYMPHEDESDLGSLVYFNDLFLSRHEIEYRMSNIYLRKDAKKFQVSFWIRKVFKLHDETIIFTFCLCKSLPISILPLPSKESSEHKSLVVDLGMFAIESKFWYISKTKDSEYSDSLTEGSSLQRAFICYQCPETVCEFQAGGALGFDKTANRFDVCSSNDCTVSVNQVRLDNFSANLLSSSASRLVLLDLSGIHFESFDSAILATCTKLNHLRLPVTFSKGVKFDLDFLGALTKLERLELALPDSPYDFSVLKSLTDLRSLKLRGSSFFYAEKLPRLSKPILNQILSTPCLQVLELSCFDIEAFDREMLDGCHRLESLVLTRNSFGSRNDDVFLNLGFPLGYDSSENQNSFSYEPGLTIYIKLIHSDILALNAASFAGMKDLQKLFLTGNSIADLPIGVFQDLRSLQRLDLDKNLIRHIRRGVFGELGNLQTLILDENPIESIEANAFVQLRHLTMLSLNRCQLKSIDSETFNGLRYLEKLSLSNNLIERIEVVAMYKRRYNVAKANLSNEEKLLVKKHLFKDLFRLRELNLAGNKLEKLDLNCFNNLSALINLDLSSNKINELSGEPAKGVLEYSDLNFANNQLTDIDKSAFPKKISWLNLAGNKLKRLDEDFFAEFTKLESINLSRNKLTMTISEASFTTARHFFLSVNFLENESIRVTEGALRERSYLYCNESVFSQHIDQYTTFKTLKIKRITPEVILSLENLARDQYWVLSDLLATWDLSECSIKALKRPPFWTNEPNHFNLNWLPKVSHPTELDLSKNFIEMLDDSELFADFKSITKINLSENQLIRINRDIFKCLLCLESIDLSGNKLTSIDMGLFRHISTSLKHLNLSSNKIAFLNLARLFRICPGLKSLNIADNQLDDRSTAESIDQRSSCYLEKLVLANNRLENMDFVRDMTSLQHLDLRGNRIGSVMSNGENLIGCLLKLTHLDLNGNRICSLKDEMFSHLRGQLSFLDLSSNPLDLHLDSVLIELF